MKRIVSHRFTHDRPRAHNHDAEELRQDIDLPEPRQIAIIWLGERLIAEVLAQAGTCTRPKS
jgi:hypothetical protein